MASEEESKLYKLNVPKYLEEAILSYGKDGCVGKLIVREVDGVPQDGEFVIDEELAKSYDPEMPTKYNVAMGEPPTHHLQVFSEEKTDVSPQVDTPQTMRFEGEIEGQLFVSSPDGLEYRKKLIRREKLAEPRTKAYEQQMEKLEPTTQEKNIDDARTNHKERLDRNHVTEMLLKMFAERPVLSFKDIQTTLMQPDHYLYKILRSVANYHNSHHVWELKPDMGLENVENDDKELKDI